jgi:predicted glycoside hydrolase/deacetylase ChbG (UPF0249 family)
MDGNPLSNPESSPCLIVNADDFGISKAVNDGIAEAHGRGIVTATSLMAAGRAFDHAVALCLAFPGLDVGVHLTLVAEKALLDQNSSLAGKDGRFPADFHQFLKRFFCGRIRLSDIRAEWEAQIRRILDCGLRVTHMDSHQHLHALPGILGLTFDLASQYHIPFVRIPLEDRLLVRPVTARGLVRMAGAAALGASFRLARMHGQRAAGFPSPRFLGFHEGGRLNPENLEGILKALKPGRVYELMCHPGFTPEDPGIRSWNYGHHTEFKTLTSPEVRSLITARRIRLCSFVDLSDGLPGLKHHPVLGPDGKG